MPSRFPRDGFFRPGFALIFNLRLEKWLPRLNFSICNPEKSPFRLNFFFRKLEKINICSIIMLQ